MRTFTVALLVLASLAGCTKQNNRAEWIGGMRNVAKLAALEVEMNKFIWGKKQNKILSVRLPSASHFAESSATIKIGIDVEKLSPDDIKIAVNSIEIKLPPVEVLDFIYRPSSFEVVEDLSNNNFFASFDVGEIEEVYRDAETEIRHSLQYTDIEELGQQYTRQLIRSYLRGVGFKEIYISFKERTSLISDFR